ncbi:MAG TPA: NUDIX hydrolase [Patescibacteria group bacterium]|jgi:8-oxo-dGTP diphosphatase|nr:NUDIX hydrolase [Patescibacteria group bacterium]
MDLQVGVKALIRNNAGEYLFIRRKKLMAGDNQLRWDIPGGRIEPEETLVEALRREIAEETDLELTKIIELLDAQDIIIPKSQLHVVRLTYQVEVGKELRLGDEHTDHRWVSLMKSTDLFVDAQLHQVLTTLQKTN